VHTFAARTPVCKPAMLQLFDRGGDDLDLLLDFWRLVRLQDKRTGAYRTRFERVFDGLYFIGAERLTFPLGMAVLAALW
jgi:hypothetical protein